MNRSAKLFSNLLKSSNGQMSVVRHSSGGLPVGKRQLEQLKNWIGSLGIYGITAAVGVVYFTDWRAVTEYIPFYRGKYHEDEE